jgi:hypothetical protein
VDVGNPEEYPLRRANDGREPACTDELQESGRAKKLGQLALGSKASAMTLGEERTPILVSTFRRPVSSLGGRSTTH